MDTTDESKLSDPSNDVLNVAGAGRLLGLHPNTVRRLASDGQLPAQKMGKAWRFARAALLAHLAPVPSEAGKPETDRLPRADASNVVRARPHERRRRRRQMEAR